jgi:hypothetical protein
VLEESEYLLREKTKYVLIGKRKPPFDLKGQENPHRLLGRQVLPEKAWGFNPWIQATN